MARRRLHGVTQQRRRKRQTRLLKRRETPVRKQATQQPAPFERSPEANREDLEFLEAMRELEVRRSPWSGEAPVRRQHVEQVQFLAEDADQALFLERMDNLGVVPLHGQSSCQTGNQDGAEGQSHPDEQDAPSVNPPVDPAHPPALEGHSTGPAEPRQPKPTAGDLPLAGEPDTVHFESAPAQPMDMEALLAVEGFDPSRKFEGAPARPNSVRQDPYTPGEHQEPDAELDLHGKTQEEAIHMVQNFLLVSHRKRLRHVLIITGKGLNSGEEGPVLKQAVRRWLERNGGRYMTGYVHAPPRLGGEGALWVWLR